MNHSLVRIGQGALLLVAGLFLLAAPARAQGDAASVYKAKCAMCHGPDGKGDTVMGKKLAARDFGSPEVQKETDDEMAGIIAKGKNKMPGYEKSLKPEQIKELVAYIRGLAKKK